MGDGHLLRKNVALALQCTHNRSQVRILLLKQAPPLPAKNNESGCAMLIKLRAVEELCFEIHQFSQRLRGFEPTGLSEELATQCSTFPQQLPPPCRL